jgi:hypothetical protein
MGYNYVPAEKDLYLKSVQRTVLCMDSTKQGRRVPCGNTVALVELDSTSEERHHPVGTPPLVTTPLALSSAFTICRLLLHL